MPNSANRSNGANHSGKGQPKDRIGKASAPKANPERSDKKQGEHTKDRRGDTGRTSSEGRKSASGGRATD